MATNNIHTCVSLNIIFGQNNPGVPVWCTDDARTAIIAAALRGHHVSPDPPPPNCCEGDYAANDLLCRLVSEGVVPAAFFEIEALSREQYVEMGYEDWSNDTLGSMQMFDFPEFTTLDIARLLYFLRRAAHCAELYNGTRPVFQLGILTTTLGGGDKHTTAQVYPWSLDHATDTIWLHRYCVVRGARQYEEHWRPFATLPGVSIAVPVEDVAVANPAAADQAPLAVTQTPSAQGQATGLLSPPGTLVTNYMNAQDYTDLGIDPALDYEAPTPPSPTPAPRPNNPANTFSTPTPSGALTYKTYDTTNLTTAELMASNPILLQGRPLLQLAQVYSNSQIFTNINAIRPGAMAAANVITKRLSKAVAEEARRTGRKDEDVRRWLMERREENGVGHKMKIGTEVYALSARRGRGQRQG